MGAGASIESAEQLNQSSQTPSTKSLSPILLRAEELRQQIAELDADFLRRQMHMRFKNHSEVTFVLNCILYVEKYSFIV